MKNKFRKAFDKTGESVTPRQEMAETRKELRCSFCRPHKNENKTDVRKHGNKTPKYKTR